MAKKLQLILAQIKKIENPVERRKEMKKFKELARLLKKAENIKREKEKERERERLRYW